MMQRGKYKYYSIAELVTFGIGERTRIFRKLKEDNAASIKANNPQGKKTAHYRISEDWQAEIDNHEADQADAVKAEAYRVEEERIKAELKAYGVKIPLTMWQRIGEDREAVAKAYSEAADYNRRHFDKYIYLIQLLDGIRPLDRMYSAIEKHNASCNKDMKTSYPAYKRELKQVKEKGWVSLFGKLGHSKGKSSVADEHFEYFKSLLLSENQPSEKSCWSLTMGKFCSGGDTANFPSVDAFMRRLERELSPSSIYRARYGKKAWDDKYGGYISRDYSDMEAGEVWVLDHAMIDVMVTINGKPCVGWLTSFVDMRTDKILAHVYRVESPNSDAIFEAFYKAVLKHGVPKTIYLDNGKDMKSKDFAGGRPKKYRLELDEQKTSGMLAMLGIVALFAIPYNAKAKTIERAHLRIKNDLAKHCIGYRGGNTQERPESLADDIKKGRCLEYGYFAGLLDDFLYNVLNKTPLNGKRCEGKSPDDVWNEQNPKKQIITRESLRMFCSRTTTTRKIGRNGVVVDGLTYFSDWMKAEKGRDVYIRRPWDNMNEAWIFAEGTEEYLGDASIQGLIPAIATEPIAQEQLRKAMKDIRHDAKITKETGVPKHSPDIAERLNLMKVSNELKNPNSTKEQEQKIVSPVFKMDMQKVVNTRKRKSEEGTADNSVIVLHSEIIYLHEQIEGAYIQIKRMRCEVTEAVNHAETLLIPDFFKLTGMEYDAFRARYCLKPRRELIRGEAASVITNVRALLTRGGAGIGAELTACVGQEGGIP